MWNPKIKQNSEYNKKETFRYKEQLMVISVEKEGRRGKIRVLRGTNYYVLYKLQGYIVQYRQHSKYFIITISGM